MRTLFEGATIVPARDNARLARQLARVLEATSDGKWNTLDTIAEITGDPPASVSARLRDLRKAKFGAYLVERRYFKDGLWEYRVGQPSAPSSAWSSGRRD